MNGEYRKMEEELREFCGGNPIVVPGTEERYLRRARTRLLKVKKKKEPRVKTMGGISRIRRIINIILNREESIEGN